MTMNKLDLDIVRLQGQAYELLKESTLPPKEVERFTEALARVITIGLNVISREMNLTEDQAMALLILIVVKATEVVDE